MTPKSGRAGTPRLGTNLLTWRYTLMARIRRLRSLIVAMSIAGAVTASASGCAVAPAYVAPARVVVVPRPVVVAPAPAVVVAPAPVVWGVIRVR
jgi:hypothetical protein